MINNYKYIRDNIKDIRERIKKSSFRVGRDPSEITLLGVTKTVEADKINIAIEEKIIDLGENRVQELIKKFDIIEKSCNWHLIGHLQTNKVKYIIDKVRLIHSVDSIELAEEINKRAFSIEKKMDILVQVNTSGEETKFGMHPKDVFQFIRDISIFPNISVKGLMTIAPYTNNEDIIRDAFKKLKNLFIDIDKENIDNIDMRFLSMGMSNDFEIAIEEGANIVRIGSSIFGERN